MADSFDAYHKWLGIPPQEQPPHHYRLLAIPTYESDPDVIAIAADRQMAHLRTFQVGQRGELSQRLLNEVSAAQVCLLNSTAKAAYDKQLKAGLPSQMTDNGAGNNRVDWPLDTPPPTFHRTSAKGANLVKKTAQSSQARGTKSGLQARIAVIMIVVSILGAAVYLAFRNDRSAASANGKRQHAPIKTPRSKTHAQTAREEKKPPAVRDDTSKLPAMPMLPPSSTRPLTSSLPAAPPKPIPDPSQPSLAENESELAKYTRGEAVDLLSLIDVERDAVDGQWRRDGDALISPGVTHSRLQVPYEPPEEYELTAVVERVAGESCLNLGLVVGRSNVMVVVDGNGGISGLDQLDGQRYPDNSTSFQGPVLNGVGPHTIVCAVRRRGVRVSCNGRLLFHWTGDPQRLATIDEYLMPDSKRLAIADYMTSYRISKLEVRPLTPPH